VQDNIFQLKDCRKLGYALYGPESGRPILYFNGTPGSRLEPLSLASFSIDIYSLLQQYNLKLIAVDRPGMGLSTFHPAGTFLSFADDVRQLADHLNISKCSLLCWSGGGPYALAMAYKHHTLIKNVFILCGFSRRMDKEVIKRMGSNKWYFLSARYVPWVLRKAMELLSRKKITKAPSQLFTGLPDIDYALMKDPHHFKAMSEYSFKEACRAGARGAVYEARGYFKDLGFQLASIQQPVHYWWGTEDTNVIRLHAEAIEQQIPGSIMHYCPHEGHLSVFVKYFPEALRTIAESSTIL
jgi:pimeloyl-ACP methyl ester carboxylesterase